MKIKLLSQFVKELQDIFEIEGDVPVYVRDSEYGEMECTNLTIHRQLGCEDYMSNPITSPHLVVDTLPQ